MLYYKLYSMAIVCNEFLRVQKEKKKIQKDQQYATEQ